ncbi:hypothetical protein ACO0LF_16605 [Undibacterium sp. Di27W]|uniref:hypothetical protein n=1 Tax=Undibacterium sp. Di27W TaxID=3413036 RepID=UPI003BF44DF1
MLIIWGKTHVRKNIGYAADFCPICRGPQVFKLIRVGLASHVYYITSGDGELVSHDRECQQCKTLLNANPDGYLTLSKKKQSLAELMKTTFPSLPEVYKDRLELEEKVTKTPTLLTPQERDIMIRTPFHLLSPLVEMRIGQTRIDMGIGLALVASFFLITIVRVLLTKILPFDEALIFLACAIIALLVTGWQILTAGSRYVKRRIIPVLGPNLKPLRPTENELKSALAELKASQKKMATRLNIADLQKYF